MSHVFPLLLNTFFVIWQLDEAFVENKLLFKNRYLDNFCNIKCLILVLKLHSKDGFKSTILCKSLLRRDFLFAGVSGATVLL